MQLIQELKSFLRGVIDVRTSTDTVKAAESIKNNIYFRGPNVWILVCAIVLASVGLNVNSTAVIIGAMLVSPLTYLRSGTRTRYGRHRPHQIRSQELTDNGRDKSHGSNYLLPHHTT